MKLSVIIPVYNGERYLAEALTSVIEQSFSDYEIIVVDDGSTDATSSVAASFPDVKYFYQEHKGVAEARNLGVSQSKAPYIAFHDADDICLPTRLEQQLSVLENYQHLGFSLCRLQNFVQPEVEVPMTLTAPELMSPRIGFVSAAVIRSEVMDRVGKFNDSLVSGEDVDWLIRAQRIGILYSITLDVLINRRLHDRNLSAQIEQGHLGLFKALRASIDRKKDDASD